MQEGEKRVRLLHNEKFPLANSTQPLLKGQVIFLPMINFRLDVVDFVRDNEINNFYLMHIVVTCARKGGLAKPPHCNMYTTIRKYH